MAAVLSCLRWGMGGGRILTLLQGVFRLVLNLGSSLTLTNTWFLMLPGAPPCIPSWSVDNSQLYKLQLFARTVSTLVFFYLLFPALLAWAKALRYVRRSYSIFWLKALKLNFILLF